jgi:hypothetical protein
MVDFFEYATGFKPQDLDRIGKVKFLLVGGNWNPSKEIEDTLFL